MDMGRQHGSRLGYCNVIWKRTAVLLVPVMMIVLTYPLAAIVWHGDAAEVGRHALMVAIQLRLGLWMLLLFAADVVLGQARCFFLSTDR
jgi:hypothetical protein